MFCFVASSVAKRPTYHDRVEILYCRSSYKGHLGVGMAGQGTLILYVRPNQLVVGAATKPPAEPPTKYEAGGKTNTSQYERFPERIAQGQENLANYIWHRTCTATASTLYTASILRRLVASRKGPWPHFPKVVFLESSFLHVVSNDPVVNGVFIVGVGCD